MGLFPGGYDWTRDYVCTLFAPTTPAGDTNGARFVAIFAMFVLCTSVAVLFQLVSRRASGRILRKTLEIGGIGSMVYAFLAVTPMHDLVLGIALLFFVPAMVAALWLVTIEGQPVLLWSGLVCLGLLLAGVTLYYGNWLGSPLAVTQKAIFAACPGWLLALQLAPSRRRGQGLGRTKRCT
jgi:hypothetical protein